MITPLRSAVVLFLVFSASGMRSQAPPPLKWEVVSVKPDSPESCRSGDGGLRFLPNGVSVACAPVLFAVEFAYHLLDPARILGLPKWASGPQSWTIDARVSAEDAAAFAKLNREQKCDMLQAVFTERFAMKTHKEMRERPAYELVVAKSGSKLRKPADATDGRSQFGGSTGEVTWANAPLTDLKSLLTEETGRPVVDHTGLMGKYDFTLEYTPASRVATDDSGKPSIFAALEEQLGLKLVPVKLPVEVLVVDSMERPSAN